MGRGKKYQPEQGVNLLRKIKVAVANVKDDGAGVQGSWDGGADVLPLAQRSMAVCRSIRLKEAGERKAKVSDG